MGTFLIHFAQIAVITLVLAAPVFWVAWRQGRRDLVRKFLVTGLAIAVLFGVVGWTSETLVNQCIEAGNTQCYDAGFRGFEVVVGGGYVLFSWFKAYDLLH